MGRTKPFRKTLKKKQTFRVGQLVEVDFTDYYSELHTSTYACRVLKVRKNGSIQVAIDADACNTQRYCVTFEESDEEFGERKFELAPNEFYRIRPLRVAPRPVVLFKPNDRVQVAWRLNDSCPVGWWKATVKSEISARGRLLVEYDFKQEGFHHSQVVPHCTLRPL